MTEPRPPHAGIAELPLDSVAPDPHQPRTSFAEEDLAELARSLRTHRVLQPIVVTPHPEVEARSATPYMILVGERRWRAAKLAGLTTIPAVLRTEEISPADRLLLQIAENDERAALSLLERSRAYQQAHRLSALTQNAFAERCGLSKGTLSRLLKVADAGGLLKQALEEKLLKDLKAARLFEQLSEETQRRLLDTAREKGQPLTVWRLQSAIDAAAPRETAQRGSEARTAVPSATRAEPPTSGKHPAACSEPSRRAENTTPMKPGSIEIRFTYPMLQDNLRFLGAKALPSIEAAAAQLVRLLGAGGRGSCR